MGSTPGGFLTGMWGVVGPRIEEKYAQKMRLQGEEKSAQIASYNEAMRNASIELWDKKRQGTLTPEETARLTGIVSYSDSQIQKTIGKDQELAPMYQKFSGVVKKILSHPTKKNGQLPGPQTQGPQAQATPQPGGYNLPGLGGGVGMKIAPPQAAPTPEQAATMKKMEALAMGGMTDADRQREWREQYVAQNGKDWSSKDKADFIAGRQFQAQQRPTTAADKRAFLKQSYLDIGYSEEEANQAVAQHEIKLSQKEETEKAHNFTKQWIELADGTPLEVMVDPRPPFTVIDPKTNKPPTQDFKFRDETLENMKARSWNFGKKSDALAIAKSVMEPKYAPLIKSGQMTREELDELEKLYAGQIVLQETENTMGRQAQVAGVTAGYEGVGSGKLSGDLPPAPVPAQAAPQGQTPQAPAAAPGAQPPQPPAAAPPAQAPPAAPVAQGPQYAPLEGANAPREQASAQYAPLISKAAADNGIDAGLLTALIRTESAFNPNAVSPKNAQGIVQFTPATAKKQGLANAFDPQQAIPAAAKLLAQLRDQFGGDMRLALAAYNAGADAVKRAGGDLTKLPKETQDYVKKILGDRASANRIITITPPDRSGTDATAAPAAAKPRFTPEETRNLTAWLESLDSVGKKTLRAQNGEALAQQVTGLDPNQLKIAAVNHEALLNSNKDVTKRQSAYSQLQNTVDLFGQNYIDAAKRWPSITNQPLLNMTLQKLQQNFGSYPEVHQLLIASQSLAGAYGRVRAAAPQSTAMPPVFAMQEGQLAIRPEATLAVMQASIDQILTEAKSETQAMNNLLNSNNAKLQADPISQIWPESTSKNLGATGGRTLPEPGTSKGRPSLQDIFK